MHHFLTGGSVGRRLTRGLLAAVVGAAALDIAPLEAQSWTNVTGNLAFKTSECGNLTHVSAVPNSEAVIAGVAARGLWINNSGTTWTRIGDVPESDRVVHRPTTIAFDPEDPKIFWVSGVYNEVGLYKTMDGGKSFRQLGNIVHNDFVSVDFGDPERRVILAGGHDQGQTVHLSADGGQTWKNVGRGLPAGTMSSSHPMVINALTYLVNVTMPSGSPAIGIYRTTDGGDSWERVSAHTPIGPAMRTSGGAIYWASNNWLLRSIDLGATWATTPVQGLRPIRPVELPGGRLAAVGESTLIVSSDGGATWAPVGAPLPYPPDGVTYSAARKAFFIWRGDCRTHVAANAVMRLDVDAPPAPPQ